MKPRWISKKALMLLHEESLASFGGGRGFIDEGLLDSALARPLNLLTYRNGKATIADLSACYAWGIARNHALVDGNKRLAFLSIGLMLHLNGYRLTADKVDAVNTMLDLAAGKVSESALATWIKHNAQSFRPKKNTPKATKRDKPKSKGKGK